MVSWSLRVWDLARAHWLINKLYYGTEPILEDADMELYSVKQICL